MEKIIVVGKKWEIVPKVTELKKNLCVYMHNVCAYLCVYLQVCVPRMCVKPGWTSSLRPHLLHFLKQDLCCFSAACGRLAGQEVLGIVCVSVSHIPRVLGLETWAPLCLPSQGPGDLNPGIHTCVAHVLLMEPSVVPAQKRVSFKTEGKRQILW